jgi:uncharacterized PurR-regulated membrane protein YhhQ (DUF165 family)
MTATTAEVRAVIPVTRIAAASAVAGYVLVIAAANCAFTLAPIAVWPGLAIPVGAVFAGVALTARDLVHEVFGARGVAVAVGLGALLSWLLAGPGIAVASAVAFTGSELVDTLLYTRLRWRSRLLAVAGSNLGGLVVDSLLFVPLAFGSFAAVPGQLAGKAAATALTVAALAVVMGIRRQVRA